MIGSAVIRRGDDQILLVREPRDEGRDQWGIPGGVVEPGELVTEAVIREVKEETGLSVVKLGPLVMVSQHYAEGFENALTAFAFKVEEFTGDISVEDPDGLVKKAAWFSVQDAIRETEKFVPGPGRDPLLAYLLDGNAVEAWMWRVGSHETSLVERL